MSQSMVYSSGDSNNGDLSVSTLNQSLNELSVKILDRHIKRNNEINNVVNNPSTPKLITEEEPSTLVDLSELDINESDYPDVCTHCEKCMAQVRSSVETAVYS